MDNFYGDIKYYESKVQDRDVKYSRANIERYINTLKKIKSSEGLSTLKEAEEYLQKKYMKIFYDNSGIVFENGVPIKKDDTCLSDFCMFFTLGKIIKTPELIWSVYDTMSADERKKLLDNKRVTYQYTANINKNIRLILEDAGLAILDLLKIDRKKFEEGLSVGERIKFQKKIGEFIKKIHSNLKTTITASTIRRVASIAQMLDYNGELEECTRFYNSRMRGVNLDGLTVEYEKSKKTNKPQLIAVKDLTDRRVLERLPLETLMLYSAFLSNRINKSFQNESESRFILEQLNGKDIRTVSDDELRAILVKLKFLRSIQRGITVKQSLEMAEEIERGDVEFDLYCDKEIDISEIDMDRAAYTEYFNNRISQNQNDFDSDIAIVFDDGNIYEGIYVQKDYAIQSLLMNLMDKSNNIVNWGYIPEEINGENSIKRGKRLVLIGIDHKGFNQPVRLHISESELEKMVIDFTGKSEIPVYKGKDDWVLDRDLSFSSTLILMPLSKANREELSTYNEKIKEGNYRRNYVSHLAWLNGGKMPSSYVDEYVDLRTGDIRENNKTLDE